MILMNPRAASTQNAAAAEMIPPPHSPCALAVIKRDPPSKKKEEKKQGKKNKKKKRRQKKSRKNGSRSRFFCIFPWRGGARLRFAPALALAPARAAAVLEAGGERAGAVSRAEPSRTGPGHQPSRRAAGPPSCRGSRRLARGERGRAGSWRRTAGCAGEAVREGCFPPREERGALCPAPARKNSASPRARSRDRLRLLPRGRGGHRRAQPRGRRLSAPRRRDLLHGGRARSPPAAGGHSSCPPTPGSGD